MKTCETCRYWMRIAAQPTGYCHRYPPAFVGMQVGTRFPVTDSTEWCGEHAERDQPIPRSRRWSTKTKETAA